MSEKKTKTVGLDLDVWRELKRISLDRDSTLSETVEFLMKRLKEQGMDDGRDTDGADDSGPANGS